MNFTALRLAAAMSAAILIAAAPARAAGISDVEIPADAAGPAITAMRWTPCAAPAQDIQRGLLVIRGVKDCEIAGDKLPLVVISHGGGGTPLSHHDTAEVLADAGFVVVTFQHPNDKLLSLDHFWLFERPTDVKRVIDHALTSSPVAARIDAARIGFFGFSRGGYTGLKLAGAAPAPPAWLRGVLKMETWVFHRDAPAQPPASEPRIKAFVIADPLPFFFDAAALAKVSAPIQLWASQNGGQGVTPEKVAAVAAALPVKPEFHAVPESTHLSFLTPCTPALAKAAADICTDPPGFDRAAFHARFNAEMLGFLRKNLTD